MAPKPTVTIRLPRKLLAQVVAAAKEDSRTTSNWVALVLERAIAARNQENE